MIHCVIVDDDLKTRQNLADLMSFDQEVTIDHTCNSAASFLSYMDSISEEKQPTLVLSDIDMPGMNGIEMVLLAKAKYPALKFLMLTVHDEDEYLFKAIKAGASGYLLKDDKVSKINQQIKALCYDDAVPISSIIAKKILGLIQKIPATLPKTTPESMFNLSEREVEILRALVDGHSYEKIAKLHFITKNTVKKHISNIYSKLHVSSKAHAIKIANNYGLI